MAEKVSIECPACAARLNLADRSKLGKKIKCPKCSEIFVAETSDEDILDDDDDFEEESEKPSSRKRAAAGGKDSSNGSKRGSAKGSSSKESSKLPLIIGGVVALIGVVGGGLYFSGAFGGKELPMAPANPVQLASSPPQSTSQAPTLPPATAHTPAAVAAAQPPVVKPPAAQPSAPPAAPSSTTPISQAEKVLGLRWMPPEIELLIHVKPADIWQAPLLKEPLSSPMVMTGLKDFEKSVGMLPSDIESVSLGIVDPSGSIVRVKLKNDKEPKGPPGPPGFGGAPGFSGPPGMAGIGFGNPAAAKAFVDELHYVLVVRTKKPVDLKLIAQGTPGAKLQESKGKTFFEVAANPNLNAPWGGWSPDSSTLVVATKKELMSSIERGETIEPRKEFKSIDHLSHLVIAAAVPLSIDNLKQTADQNKTELPGMVVSQILAYENYGFRIGSLSLTVKGGFDLKISALSETDAGAAKLRAEFEKQKVALQLMFDSVKKTAPPLLADLGEMLLANLNIDATNQTVTASTSLPDSEKGKLEQLPPLIMMMAMMGGQNGFGGPPGAPPGMSLPGGDAQFKLPGETDPVDATSFEGLPEGMTLTASTGWVPGVASVGSGGAPVALETPGSMMEVIVDVRGEGLKDVCAVTGVTSKTIKLEGGGTAKKPKLTLPGGIDAQKTFIPFDVESEIPFEHPPETLRVKLQLELPANAGTKINVLEGSFKYLTFGNSQELSVENVPQTAKQPLKGADFKAGGVKLIRGPKDAVPESLKLECGKDHFLGKVKGTPGDIISMTEMEKGASIQRIYARPPENKFPDDFQISFKLHSSVKEHTVSFRFENVPLPSPESKPQK